MIEGEGEAEAGINFCGNFSRSARASAGRLLSTLCSSTPETRHHRIGRSSGQQIDCSISFFSKLKSTLFEWKLLDLFQRLDANCSIRNFFLLSTPQLGAALTLSFGLSLLTEETNRGSKYVSQIAQSWVFIIARPQAEARLSDCAGHHVFNKREWYLLGCWIHMSDMPFMEYNHACRTHAKASSSYAAFPHDHRKFETKLGRLLHHCDKFLITLKISIRASD